MSLWLSEELTKRKKNHQAMTQLNKEYSWIDRTTLLILLDNSIKAPIHPKNVEIGTILYLDVPLVLPKVL